MSPAIRAIGALICLGLVVFGTSLTRAAPKHREIRTWPTRPPHRFAGDVGASFSLGFRATPA